MLPELDAVKLGCGADYVSARLMRRGARVIGLDDSTRQLGTAQTMQEEFGLRFALVHADPERTPFADETFEALCKRVRAQGA